jgi:hypothetical protein
MQALAFKLPADEHRTTASTSAPATVASATMTGFGIAGALGVNTPDSCGRYGSAPVSWDNTKTDPESPWMTPLASRRRNSSLRV